MIEILSASSGHRGNDDFETFEVIAKKAGVAGNQRVALKQGVGPDDEVLDGAWAGVAASSVAALHFAGAQSRFLLDRAVGHTHVLEGLHGLVAVAQRTADFRHDNVAYDDRASSEGVAQRSFGRIG